MIVVGHAGASHASAYNQLHMRFQELLNGVAVARRAGPNPDGEPVIRAVEYDSRRIGPGSLFLAMQGSTTDGNRFIGKAVEQGAVAGVTDSASIVEIRVQGERVEQVRATLASALPP